MELNKKMINRLENSIKRMIDNYEPFEYSDRFAKFVRIDPYILWNKYQKRYTLNLFYIFDEFTTLPANNKSREHGYKLIQLIKSVLPFTKEMDYDIHIKTKQEYEIFEYELIPSIRSLIPEQKVKLMEEKNSEEYYVKIENSVNKFLSKFKSDIDDDNFLGYKVIVGKSKYSSQDLEVKITGIFKTPFKMESSDKIHKEARKIAKLLRDTIPYLKYVTISGGSTSTLDSYNNNLKWEKSYMGRVVESKLPFKQTTNNGIKTRVFNESVDNHELKWHRDENDRIVKVIKSNGWKFQIDNQLPITLKEGSTFKIPSGVFHRVIKGGGDLIIKIKEI
jgi:hypothetical protein